MKKILMVIVALGLLSLASCTMAVSSDRTTSSSLVGAGAIEGIKIVVGSN